MDLLSFRQKYNQLEWALSCVNMLLKMISVFHAYVSTELRKHTEIYE